MSSFKSLFLMQTGSVSHADLFSRLFAWLCLLTPFFDYKPLVLQPRPHCFRAFFFCFFFCWGGGQKCRKDYPGHHSSHKRKENTNQEPDRMETHAQKIALSTNTVQRKSKSMPSLMPIREKRLIS